MSISEKNLNSFDEDIYDRKIIAENLTKIIDSQNDPVVISLDSEWGTGKTTFVTMWKNMLDSEEEYNSKFETLYFNAWENDYIKDPLLAIFSEMEKQIHEKDSRFRKGMDKIISKAKPFGKAVVSTGARLATAGMLNLDRVDLGDYNEEELIKLSEKLGELSINEISADKTIRRKFKEEMIKYQQDINKKIVFFIDELDRCRPTFAIELLEVIKHLFNINNFIFIISIDKEQLAHSVSTIYGLNMDTLGYLRRFFDLDYKLPQIDLYEYIRSKSSIIFDGKYNIELFKLFINEMFINEMFTLRDVDKANYYLSVLVPLIKEFNKEGNYSSQFIATISFLYAIFITIKIKKPILYKQIIDRNYDVEDIIGKFNIPSLDHYEDMTIGDWNEGPLQELMNQILKPFLILNLRQCREGYITEREDEEFTIGLKNKEGQYYCELDLCYLFNVKKLDIIDKMGFIESFKIN